MKRKQMEIDIVIPWVDGEDNEWLKELEYYVPDKNVDKIRFQSWNTLQYVFRGIEKYMPWVRYVFFVTWGHIPSWLDLSNQKLRVVKHRDYIPEKYLPTFNSNTIEMNYHRIEELSEHFILFNDDIYILTELPQDYFFKEGLPCGESIETHFVLKGIGDADIQIAHAQVNNSVILNDHFDKREVIKKNYDKWFSSALGERVSHNEAMQYWNNFESFVFPHEAMPMLKSTFVDLWNLEFSKLDRASSNRFRASTDVTHRLISQWQFCTGNYVPRKSLGHVYHVNNENIEKIVNEIRKKKYPIVCLNEDSNQNFVLLSTKVKTVLQELLPEISSFEKK